MSSGRRVGQSRRCSCPFCVRPASPRVFDGLVARAFTVETSKLYKILNLKAMCDEVLNRDT